MSETFKTQRCKRRWLQKKERTDDMFAYSCQYKVGENKLAEGERLNKVAVAKAIPYALPSYQRYVANAVLPVSQNASRLTNKEKRKVL